MLVARRAAKSLVTSAVMAMARVAEAVLIGAPFPPLTLKNALTAHRSF